ncbi:hypothetical protein BACIH_3739 [Bacillus amyloliquefaciens]|nr:hypothetical protein BACIH_3739 [Bacillus amyloliquefaciens]RAP18271.1 hypothetical protein C2W63_02446 [Bacillus velezensis]
MVKASSISLNKKDPSAGAEGFFLMPAEAVMIRFPGNSLKAVS